MNENWVIKNSPFEILDIAFRKLFPNVQYTAYFEPNIRDDEQGNTVCGLTDFDESGNVSIFIDCDLSINDATEIFAHELAHAGVGIGHDHDEVWEKAFDDIFNEYNKIGDELFSSSVETPKRSEYTSAYNSLKDMTGDKRMTCKDCIRYEVCKQFNIHIPEEFEGIENHCEEFKNKSDFVEVVRCPECIYCENMKCTELKDNTGHFLDVAIFDYCSQGVRK